MSLRVLALFTFAVLSPGCVPVTEPVGDVDKAEPDKNLVGKWAVAKARGTPEILEIQSVTVSIPEVKGNPKGLMHASMNQKNGEHPIWFFTTTVGKHTYVNLIVGPTGNGKLPSFDKEGAFAEWEKAAKKEYFVCRLTRDGGKFILDGGNNDAFTRLMKESDIKETANSDYRSFETPAGWLAKYLDKTGPDKLFDGTNDLALTREKK